MTQKRTDFRLLKVRRAIAMARPELRHRREGVTPETRRMIDDAVRAGRVTRCPAGKGERR